MPGYKVQVKGEDGGMVDIPLAAQYDGKGKEISSEYATKASVNGKYTKPSGGIPESDLSAEVRASLSRADSALQTAPVTSVNSKTGNVALSAADVGAATEESVSAILNNTNLIKNESGGFQGGTGAHATHGGAIGENASATYGGAIGENASATSGGAVGSEANATYGGAVGLMASATTGGAVGQRASATNGFAGGYSALATANGAVQLGTGENKTENTLQFRGYQIVDANGNIPASRLSANSPVRSVNGKTGAVTLAKNDVGLSNVDNVKQYSASNPPPYPVRSVNGKAGAVTLSASDVGAATAAQGAKADSAAQLNKAQTWTQEQRFNAGFSALNGNFSFSDTTNIGMELGRRDGTAGTPYIDFHTDGSSSTDYNSRLLATGNQLQVTASGGFSVNGKNIEIFDSVVDTGNAVTVTAPASGDTIQAPDNGWYCLGLHSTARGFVNFRQKKEDGNDRWGVVNLVLSFDSGWPCFYFPVKSGDLVNVSWSNATVNRLQFIRTTSLRDV